MHQSTSPRRALGLTLLLVAALVFQSFPVMRTNVVAARGSSPIVREGANAALVDATKDTISNEWLPQPQPAPTVAPEAAVIAATLTDNITAATKVAPGATINYTATITNNGAATPADDATNVNFSAPLDANTTLVAGSVHASPIAFNDTYNWVGNTQLDTSARALPPVATNDVAVNAPGGTDTFNITPIAGGPTALGGTVSLLATGHYTYTPPLGRPNIADGATVQDSFTYTITNNADPSLTSTGTVRINLTGRVWYLQAGAAGDGRSNTPSSSPSAMSTAADKSTDIFYIFSNPGSLNGLFTVDAGQQLLGQGVGLTVSSISLFSAAAPTPTTTNTTGNCVTLAGAPGNNTLSGFDIGNCSGLAIFGSSVGTLTINTLSINTTGGGLVIAGSASPTVSIVLGGLTATGGTAGVAIAGLNGTINLGGGTLSGASSTEFAVTGGAATISYTGAITQNNAQRVVEILSTTGGSVGLSGTVTGGSSSLGVNINAVNGSVTFTTLNLGTSGSRMTNQALTITGGSGTKSLGAVGIFTSSAKGMVISNSTGAISSTSGTVDSTNATAVEISGVSAASRTPLNIQLTTVNTTGGSIAANGIALTNTSATGVPGGFRVLGNGGTCTFSTPTCCVLAGRAQQRWSGQLSRDGLRVRDVDRVSAKIRDSDDAYEWRVLRAVKVSRR